MENKAFFCLILIFFVNLEATDANFSIGRTSSAAKFISRRSPSFLAIVAPLRGLSAKELFNLDECNVGSDSIVVVDCIDFSV